MSNDSNLGLLAFMRIYLMHSEPIDNKFVNMNPYYSQL